MDSDCAFFECGCIMSKVPGLLRRRERLDVAPDRHWTDEYALILLNGAHLRKGPRFGYTRASQGQRTKQVVRDAQGMAGDNVELS
ncbi:hypothetical protein D0B32_21220 [Paraburkholderia sp. DHOC27]|nr:hypothetical protein D0B32_21220 [Paraburkholderia sp. DHOC27]